MNLWVIAAGVLGGLGIFLIVRELVPAPARLDAALARLDQGALDPGPERGARGSLGGQLAQRIAAELPWLPVPAADLALLGQGPRELAGQQDRLRPARARVPLALFALLSLATRG